MIRKKIYVPTIIALSVSLGFAMSATVSANQHYESILAPIAILLSAFVAGWMATNYLTLAEKSRKMDRTVNFIANYDPFTRPEFISLLYSAERELNEAMQVYKAANVCGPEMVANLKNLRAVVEDLSMEQAQAIHTAANFFEMLVVNLSSNYFDKNYVLQIYGDNFGLQFWARTWPVLKYSQLSNLQYQSLKGIPNNSLGGSYSSLERWVLSHVADGDIFPMPDQKLVAYKRPTPQ